MSQDTSVKFDLEAVAEQISDRSGGRITNQQVIDIDGGSISDFQTLLESGGLTLEIGLGICAANSFDDRDLDDDPGRDGPN